MRIARACVYGITMGIALGVVAHNATGNTIVSIAVGLWALALSLHVMLDG